MKLLLNISIYLLLISCFGCGSTKQVGDRAYQNSIQARHNFEVVPSKIAFGSCSKFDYGTDIWPFISKEKPDLWIWLGDIVYADTDNKRITKYS